MYSLNENNFFDNVDCWQKNLNNFDPPSKKFHDPTDTIGCDINFEFVTKNVRIIYNAGTCLNFVLCTNSIINIF